MQPQRLKNIIAFIGVSAATSVMFFDCQSGPKEETATSGGIFSFTASPYPPADIDSNATDTALAAYAWQEFLALNWKSSYGMTGLKGEPDTTWTYISDKNGDPDTVVWETYAHRSELSPYYYPMRPFDSACKYSYQYPPVPGAGSPSYGLFHNLDETSEIGSCTLYAFADSANQFKDNQYLVRYQAKTNRTEYEYIRNSFTTAISLSNAVDSTKKYYDSLFNGKKINVGGTMLNLPNGSIEVKTAWRPLKPTEDASKFFTRTVIDYSDQAINTPTLLNNQTFTYTNRTYALIGMHIIHKSPNQPSFVFATWEHVGVQQDSMRYILISNGYLDSVGYMTPIRNPIEAIYDLATEYVHQKLLPTTSVWQNYRLVGVQATPTSDVTKPSFFLANYVVESDSLLARFHGSGFGTPFNAQPNVAYNNNLYSVGGCQGCHGGGAQHTGTDFSFIVNSPNHAPDPVVGQPAAKGVMTTKFARLKKLSK